MRSSVHLTLFMILFSTQAAGQLPDSLAPRITFPVQDFEFWVGEWGVNLRTRQDLSWQDTYSANAKIYSVLNGKAVLELWDESSIKGFSLRYFDPVRNAWILWLNWPRNDRSGSSSLEGNFKNGRGEFFSSVTDDDGNEVTSRYTFADITRTTLRWDDAYSSDGGATWSHQWIMEFTRLANAPRLDGSGGPAHTFAAGDRCVLPQFRSYEFLSGPWVGTLESGRRGPTALTGFRILGGCSVLLFAGVRGHPQSATRFAHLTWNTMREQFEMLRLASDSAAQADLFYGETTDNGFVFYAPDVTGAPENRIRIERLENDGVLWIEETSVDGDWSLVWGARVHRFVAGRN